MTMIQLNKGRVQKPQSRNPHHGKRLAKEVNKKELAEKGGTITESSLPKTDFLLKTAVFGQNTQFFGQ